MEKGFLAKFWKKLPYLLGSLINCRQIAKDQSPLPRGSWVLRFARAPKDYKEKRMISAVQLDEAFCLSSEDKLSVPPHLSVWDESLTTPEQAFSILLESSPNSKRELLVRLEVDKIRAIIGSSGGGVNHPNLLNVIWVNLFKDPETRKIKDSRPGADGHSGIIGLDDKSTSTGLTARQAKDLRKSLRAQLAELASQDHRLCK